MSDTDDDQVPGAGFELLAAFGAKIGTLTDSIERDRAERRAALARRPVNHRSPVSLAYPASGNLALDMGGPSQGRVWLVRRVVVGGITWGTVAAGTAELYISALPSNLLATERPMNELIDQAASLPLRAFYSNEQAVVAQNERLVLVVVGGTAAQQYVGACSVVDYAPADGPSDVISN